MATWTDEQRIAIGMLSALTEQEFAGLRDTVHLATQHEMHEKISREEFSQSIEWLTELLTSVRIGDCLT